MADYIKREDSINALNVEAIIRNIDHSGRRSMLSRIVESVKRVLRAIPAVDIRENVHAAWRLEEENTLPSMVYCTNCRQRFRWIDAAVGFLYCPRCGAMMDEEGDA